MEDILGISDWIALRHPEMVIDGILWETDPRRYCPGTAWCHMYAEKRDLDIVVCCDDYEKIVPEYEAYVELVRHNNAREARRI